MAKEEVGPRSFGVLLTQIEDGALHAELSAIVQKMQVDLHEIADQRGQAKGELVLKIAFAHEKKGVVAVKASVDTKMPKGERGTSVFWLTDDANLSPENPRQQKLPLREVSPPERRELPAEDRKTRSV